MNESITSNVANVFYARALKGHLKDTWTLEGHSKGTQEFRIFGH